MYVGLHVYGCILKLGAFVEALQIIVQQHAVKIQCEKTSDGKMARVTTINRRHGFFVTL